MKARRLGIDRGQFHMTPGFPFHGQVPLNACHDIKASSGRCTHIYQGDTNQLFGAALKAQAWIAQIV